MSIELLIRNLLYFANMRIRELISALDLPPQKKELIREEVATDAIAHPKSWKLLRHLVQTCIFLLRDRNVDCLLVCSIYAIAKLCKIELGFVALLSGFSKLFPDSLHRVKYNIVMQCEELNIVPEKPRGNIIDFYNHVFVIANNEYLVSLKKDILCSLNGVR